MKTKYVYDYTQPENVEEMRFNSIVLSPCMDDLNQVEKNEDGFPLFDVFATKVAQVSGNEVTMSMQFVGVSDALELQPFVRGGCPIPPQIDLIGNGMTHIFCNGCTVQVWPGSKLVVRFHRD